jgi:hypothetical protein
MVCVGPILRLYGSRCLLRFGVFRRVVNVAVGVLFAVLATMSVVEKQWGVAAVQGVFCAVNVLVSVYVPPNARAASSCTSG